MAIRIHVARTAFLKISGDGTVLKDKSGTIKDNLTGSHEHRVLEDSTNTNTTNHPTIDNYLTAEAEDDFVLYYLDQNMVVTYNQSDINDATNS